MTEPRIFNDRFILHWLDDSRSQRILWVLEILQLDYEVKIYLRHPQTIRAPLQLFDVHKLGKSPVLEIIFGDGRPSIKMAESGFIMQYLLRYYDTNNILNPINPDQQLEVDYFLHYSEGSLQHIQIALLINSAAKHISPFGTKKIVKTITKAINNGYYKHEWYLNMQYLEDRLIKNGTGFFVGDKLTGADVILSFPIHENVFDNLEGVKEILHDDRDMRKLYPNLYKWSKMIKNQPSYKKICQTMDEEVEDLIASNPRFDYGKE
ncbi:Glutathione S-transferase 1 [Candida tropicalis]